MYYKLLNFLNHKVWSVITISALAFLFLNTESNLKAQAIEFSTYLGGSEYDFCNHYKVVNGKTYIAGNTRSFDFPVTNGSSHTLPIDQYDFFFAIYDQNDDLIFATYWGGSAYEFVKSMEIVNGEVFIFGYTQSTDFPTTDGTTNNGNYDNVLVKFDLDGNLLLSTIFGGSDYDNFVWEKVEVYNNQLFFLVYTTSTDYPVTDGSTFGGTYADIVFHKMDLNGNLLVASYLGNADAVDDIPDFKVDNNMAYFVGYAYDNGFPVTDGSTVSGYSDVLYAKVNLDGQLLSAKYIGGSDDEYPYNINIDNSGNVYISGDTYSDDFPITNGNSFSGYNDLFLLKMDVNDNVVFSKLIGGQDYEYFHNMILSGGILYAAGQTASNDFPVTNGSTYAGNGDIIYVQIDLNGNLIFATYIGGSESDGAGIGAINDEIHLTGYTYSSDFPVTNGSTLWGTNYDRLYIKMTPNAEILYSTYFGGSLSESNIRYIEVDGDMTYLVGYTYSNDFPVTEGSLSGIYDGYYMRINTCISGYQGGTSVTPQVQDVCENGYIDLIVGEKNAIPGSSLPIIYRNGIPHYQNEITADYQWQESDASDGPWTDITGAIAKNYQPDPVVNDKYFRRLTLAAGGCDESLPTSDVASIIVGTEVAPIVDAGDIFNTCPNSPVTIGGIPTATDGTPPYTYAWTTGASNNIFSTNANPTVTPFTNGTSIYTVSVTDANGCMQVDQCIVNAYQADAGVAQIGFCEGSNGALIGGVPVAGLPGVQYSWSPTEGLSCTNCAQPLASPSVNTTYTLSLTVPVTGGGTCTTTDNILVLPTNAPTTPNFAGPDVVVCLGQTAELGMPAESGFNYTWAPGNYLTQNQTAQTTFQTGNLQMPTINPITYYVTAEKNGCTFVDETVAAVIEARAGVDGCGPRMVGLPDRTPNINETYTWTKVSGDGYFTGATDQPMVPVSASPDGGSTTYRLDVTYNGHTCTDFVVVPPCGCVVVISVSAPFSCPDFGLNGGDVTLIASAADIFSGDPDDFTYSWSPAEGLSSTTDRIVTLTDDVERTYTVTMSSPFDPSFNCSASIAVNYPAWSFTEF